MIRQALDDEEAGRQPPKSSMEIIDEYSSTLRILMADRPIQMDAVGAMELEIRQQRDEDLVGADGYAKAPKLPGHQSNSQVADARSRLEQGSPDWAGGGALPTPDPQRENDLREHERLRNQANRKTPDVVADAVRRRAA